MINQKETEQICFSFVEALQGGWVRLTVTVCPDIQSASCLTNMCWQRSGVPSVSKQASTDPTGEGTVIVKSRTTKEAEACLKEHQTFMSSVAKAAGVSSIDTRPNTL